MNFSEQNDPHEGKPTGARNYHHFYHGKPKTKPAVQKPSGNRMPGPNPDDLPTGNPIKDMRNFFKNRKNRQANKERDQSAAEKAAPNLKNIENDVRSMLKRHKENDKKESMNYSEWLDSLCDPLYEANGDPQCPPGYKYNKKTERCEPKTQKDDVSGSKGKNNHPDNGPGFNVIGSHGMNGAPYAYEEPATDGGGE